MAKKRKIKDLDSVAIPRRPGQQCWYDRIEDSEREEIDYHIDKYLAGEYSRIRSVTHLRDTMKEAGLVTDEMVGVQAFRHYVSERKVRRNGQA